MDYGYDALNRLSSVTDNRLPAPSNITTYGYDNVGNLQSFVYPNLVAHVYSYNTLNRLTNLTVSRLAASQASYTYTLGPTGNRTSVTELSERKATYTYDDLYRLKQEDISGGTPNGSIAYVYDKVGNRKTRTSTVAGITNQTFNYDANDRIATEGYDNNGNTINANIHVYKYDYENHLVDQDGGAVKIIYDGDGNRVAKIVGGITTRYLVDDRNPTGYAQVLEEIEVGIVKKSYTHGHKLISQHQSTGVNFYGYDGHGSVRQLTNAAGTTTDTYTYDAFGNLIGQTGTTSNTYLYAGEQLDANLGHYYLRARYLGVGAGRFLTGDSYEGTNADPLSQHAYQYANANATNSIDPTGNWTLSELSVTNAIQGVLRIQQPLRTAYTLRSAKEKLSLGLGLLETSYALLKPHRTEVGIEWTFKFKDFFDRRVHPSITISCTQTVGSSRVCDKLDVTLQPRATLPGTLTFGWDFASNTVSFSPFNPAIPFTLIKTKYGELLLEASLDVSLPSLVDSSLKLDFKLKPPSVGGLAQGSGFGSVLGATASISQIEIPADLRKLSTVLGLGAE